MERCGATAQTLPVCSRTTPSLSAEECMAHQNSRLAKGCVLKRSPKWIRVAKEDSDDGKHDGNFPTD